MKSCCYADLLPHMGLWNLDVCRDSHKQLVSEITLLVTESQLHIRMQQAVRQQPTCKYKKQITAAEKTNLK